MSSICFTQKLIKPATIQWIVLWFAAINVVFLGGKRRAFGAFIAQLHKEYANVSLVELNWVGDSYSALGHVLPCVSTPLILYFQRRYCIFQLLAAVLILLSCVTSSFVPNPHWMFLTHTLLHGVGSGIILSVTGLIVMEYFDNNHPYRILATTLISGGSIASIVFVPLFAYFIQRYSWRGAFLFLGLIYFIVNVSAAFFFKKNESLNQPNGKRFGFFCNKIKTPQIPLLILWFLDKVFMSIVLYGLLLNLTDYVYRGKINLLDSSLLTTIFAAGEGLSYLSGAILTALTKTFLNGKMGFIQIVSALVTTISLVVMEFTRTNIVVERLMCFLAGWGLGYTNTFLYPSAEELTRLPGHIAFPYSLSGIGLGMMISPVLTAKLAEVFRYQWFFLIQGILIFLKTICLIVMVTLLWYYDKHSIDIEYEESPGEVSAEKISDSPTETSSIISIKR